jgi:hypothetical protein
MADEFDEELEGENEQYNTQDAEFFIDNKCGRINFLYQIYSPFSIFNLHKC